MHIDTFTLLTLLASSQTIAAAPSTYNPLTSHLSSSGQAHRPRGKWDDFLGLFGVIRKNAPDAADRVAKYKANHAKVPPTNDAGGGGFKVETDPGAAGKGGPSKEVGPDSTSKADTKDVDPAPVKDGDIVTEGLKKPWSVQKTALVIGVVAAVTLVGGYVVWDNLIDTDEAGKCTVGKSENAISKEQRAEAIEVAKRPMDKDDVLAMYNEMCKGEISEDDEVFLKDWMGSVTWVIDTLNEEEIEAYKEQLGELEGSQCQAVIDDWVEKEVVQDKGLVKDLRGSCSEPEEVEAKEKSSAPSAKEKSSAPSAKEKSSALSAEEKKSLISQLKDLTGSGCKANVDDWDKDGRLSEELRDEFLAPCVPTGAEMKKYNKKLAKMDSAKCVTEMKSIIQNEALDKLAPELVEELNETCNAVAA